MPNQPTNRFSFDLASEPWLPCRLLDGSVTTLSVLEIFQRAHEVSDLVLETPTQFPPILRMLLAVLHSALDMPWSDNQWLALLEAGSFTGRSGGASPTPAEKIEEYLSGPAAGKFDIFDPMLPFMQAGGLRAGTKTCAALMPHIATGNNVPLFSGDRDREPRPVSPAEVARWLLHVHAWDTGGIKTGSEDDPSAAGGRSYGNHLCPLGELGVLVPCGDTLWHTLLFNLVTLDDELSPQDDRPVWERPEPLAADWEEDAAAEGLLSLYTWPARRVRLVPELQGGQVVVRTVALCPGDRLAAGEAKRLEPHTAFVRRAQPGKKKPGKKTADSPIQVPLRHQPDRKLWRGLGTILAQQQSNDEGAGSGRAAPYVRALVLEHLGSFDRNKALGDTIVRLRAFGLAYNKEETIIQDAYFDELPLPVALLRAQNTALETTALKAVRAADDTARHLGDLAANIDRAAGCRDDKLLTAVSSAARSRLYFHLDHEFPRWIVTLSDTDPQEAMSRWCRTVSGYASRIASDLLAEAPLTAIAGRKVKKPGADDGQASWMDTAVAELTYRAGVRRALATDNADHGQQDGDTA